MDSDKENLREAFVYLRKHGTISRVGKRLYVLKVMQKVNGSQYYFDYALNLLNLKRAGLLGAQGIIRHIELQFLEKQRNI